MLAYPLLSDPVSFQEERISVLVLENRKMLRKALFTLAGQIAGETGDFILSENFEPISLAKNACLITDPFSLELNSKKAIAKLEQSAECAAAEFAESFQDIRCRIHELAAKLSLEMPFPVTFSELADNAALIKIMGLSIDTESMSFPECILEYIELQRTYFSKKLFIFYNLKGVMDTKELKLFYKAALYRKMTVFLIEDMQRSAPLEEEQLIIIDKDLCQI